PIYSGLDAHQCAVDSALEAALGGPFRVQVVQRSVNRLRREVGHGNSGATEHRAGQPAPQTRFHRELLSARRESTAHHTTATDPTDAVVVTVSGLAAITAACHPATRESTGIFAVRDRV